MIPQVLEKIMESYDSSERQMITSAYETAAIELVTMTRGNSHPFIEHPLGVISIACNEMGLQANAVAAILLHEANRFQTDNLSELNRTELFLSYRNRYPKDVIDIVAGLNNIAGITLQQTNLDPERYRKLIVSYSPDPRVVLLKIADRLEIMRNIKLLPASKQKSKATETMMLYTPLAHQLGLYRIKSEFEDIFMRLTQPAEYKSICDRLKSGEKSRQALARQFIDPLKEKLDNNGIRYTLKSRTKSPYSIWNKMVTKHVTFDEIFDIFAMRFIVECENDHEKEEELCWKIYSLVTEEYEPDESRLRDWISKPKENGYESLHTTVKVAEGSFVEVQIRTERMDLIAEQGFAAHWSYKGIKSKAGFTQWLNNVRNIMHSSDSWQYEQSSMVLDEILVFSPSGELRQLKNGSSVLDFAFEIHTNLGLKCCGGKINGKIASIRERLKSGDTVDIITNKNQKPNADWLNYVVSSKARSKIKQKLKEEENKRAATGKELLDRRLRNWKLEMSDARLASLVKKYKFDNINEFFGAIGEGKIDLSEIKEYLAEEPEKTRSVTQESQENKTQSQTKPQLDAKLKNFEYRTARCCNPSYDDEVFGFLTIKEGIKIHRQDCPNARRLRERYPYRVLEIQWKQPEGEKTSNGEKADTHKRRKGK